MLHFLFNERYTTPTLGYVSVGLLIAALCCIPVYAVIYIAESDRCEPIRAWLTAHTGRPGQWLAMSLRGLIGLGFIALSSYTIPQTHADPACYDPGLNSPCCPPHWVQTVKDPETMCINWFHDPATSVRAPQR